MSEIEQMHFYIFQEREHWKWMDLELMKAKLQVWVTKERRQLKARDRKSSYTMKALIKVRDKINYCLRNGIKAYEISPYNFKQ